MAFSQILAIRSKTKPYKCQKYKKLALNSRIQTYNFDNKDEVCIPNLSSILIAVYMFSMPRTTSKRVSFAVNFHFSKHFERDKWSGNCNVVLLLELLYLFKFEVQKSLFKKRQYSLISSLDIWNFWHLLLTVLCGLPLELKAGLSRK